MWPPYFPHPPAPPAAPEPEPVKLGRCVFCECVTGHYAVVGLDFVWCCPKNECQKDLRERAEEKR